MGLADEFKASIKPKDDKIEEAKLILEECLIYFKNHWAEARFGSYQDRMIKRIEAFIKDREVYK